MEQHKTPERLSVNRIIELTKGAYCAEEFEKFFVQEKKP
jgi:hypothetical protein